MQDLLSRLRRQFAGVMDVQDTALSEYAVKYVEYVLHGTRVVFVTTMQFGQGIHNYECWLEIGHNLYQIGHIVRLVDDIQGPTKVRGVKDDKIPLVRVGPKRWQFNPLLFEHVHAFKPERVGGVELQIEHPTPRTQGRTT